MNVYVLITYCVVIKLNLTIRKGRLNYCKKEEQQKLVKNNNFRLEKMKTFC